jgi:hypothetical protein
MRNWMRNWNWTICWTNCSMSWTRKWMSNLDSKNWINRLNLARSCLEVPDLNWKSARHWMDCCLTALRIPRKTTRAAAVALPSWTTGAEALSSWTRAAVALPSWTRVAAVAEAVCWNWTNRLKSYCL